MRHSDVTTWMADQVREAVRAADLPAYTRFLDAMAHYTRHSGERLAHAARGTDGELSAFFARMSREEAGHWRLAQADLEALGGQLSASIPPSVQAFHAHWMAAEDPAEWIGALLALEGVGQHLGADVLFSLGRLGLPRTAARFVLVHLEVDQEHEALTQGFASAFDDAVLSAAAERAGRFWVGLHQEALGA